MTISKEMNDKINEFYNSWEAFKQKNDERMADIEKKGKADCVTIDQINTINKSMDQAKTKIEKLELAINRPSIGKPLHLEPVENEEKAAFSRFLRKGDGVFDDMERKSLSVSSDSDGGYLVTPYMSDKIISKLKARTVMRKLAWQVEISTDSYEMLVDEGDVGSGWVAETDARGETSTAPIEKRAISVHELYANPRATQKLLDDSNLDVEAWLADKIADSFIQKEQDSFINGDGINKPEGVLYPNISGASKRFGTTDVSITSFEADNVLQFYYSLDSQYLDNSSFLMSRKVMHVIRSLKDNNGSYIWSPGFDIGAPGKLLGLPVYESEFMPDYAAGNYIMAVGDFKEGYAIIDRKGVSIMRDPYSHKPFISFYATKRLGGGIKNYNSLKLFNLMA